MEIRENGEIEMDANEAFKIVRNTINEQERLGRHVFKDTKSIYAWDILEKYFGVLPDDFDPLDFNEDENIKF